MDASGIPDAMRNPSDERCRAFAQQIRDVKYRWCVNPTSTPGSCLAKIFCVTFGAPIQAFPEKQTAFLFTPLEFDAYPDLEAEADSYVDNIGSLLPYVCVWRDRVACQRLDESLYRFCASLDRPSHEILQSRNLRYPLYSVVGIERGF